MNDIITNELTDVHQQEFEVELESKTDSEENSAALILKQDDFTKLKAITEALLFASDKPLSVKQLSTILDEHNQDINTRVKDKIKFNNKYILLALDELILDYNDSAIEIKITGTGYRIQTKADYAVWVQRLWQEKPSKYSKATLETLAIIAYRQPITRGEIEHIRGVAVSSHIIRNLHERNWIKVVGYKELPGRPAIYATTAEFLADLNLEKLEDLPTLADIKEIKQDLFSQLENDADFTTIISANNDSEQIRKKSVTDESDFVDLQDE